MKTLDPGHLYELDRLDDDGGVSVLRFVKRVGEGNAAPAYGGTTTQEVLRALIDRMKYVDAQIHDQRNTKIIQLFRWSLYMLEERAAKIRGELRAFAEAMIGNETIIESLPTCATCGHIACGVHS